MHNNISERTGLTPQGQYLFGSRFKHYCLNTVSAMAISLYPLQVAAQMGTDGVFFDQYDTRVDTAAAYTEVLYDVQRNLGRYLSGTAGGVKEGLRAGDTVAQEAYIDAIATAIKNTEQPPAQGSANDLRTFPYAMAGSFDIAFRYCGGRLLSYFDTTEFKRNLTEEQIQNAPLLQAIREGKNANSGGLFMLRTVGGERELIGTGLRKRSYPACFDVVNGVADPLPDGTLVLTQTALLKTRASYSQKVGTERKIEVCEAGTVGSGRRMYRNVYQDKNELGHAVGERTPEDTWTVMPTGCSTPLEIKQHIIENCPQGGVARFEFDLTQAQDPANPFKTIWVPANLDASGNPILVRDMLVGQCENVPPKQKTLDPVRDETFTETQSPSCNVAYPSYPGALYGAYREERTRRERIFELPFLSEDVNQITYTNWESVEDGCYRNQISDAVATRTIACPTSWVGVHRQQRTLRTTVTDYANPSYTDPRAVAVIKNWTTVLNTCQPAPPSGGSGSSGTNNNSVDVDGDGQGDYKDAHAAYRATGSYGVGVENGCGPCNGPDKGGSSGGSSTGGSGSSGGSSGGGGCFLTTAIVGQRGEADDGPTLSKLRNFRDTYMASNPDMVADIAHYYDVAPQLVATIPLGHKDWLWIESQVDQAVLHIDADELDEAYNVYRAMVEQLMADWIK